MRERKEISIYLSIYQLYMYDNSQEQRVLHHIGVGLVQLHTLLYPEHGHD